MKRKREGVIILQRSLTSLLGHRGLEDPPNLGAPDAISLLTGLIRPVKLVYLMVYPSTSSIIVFMLRRFSQLLIVKVGRGWLRYSESCSTATFRNHHPLRIQLQLRPLLPRRLPIPSN